MLSWSSRVDEICTFFRQGNVKRVLDLGAGTGVFSIPLAQLGFEVVALDLSNQMLKVLKKKTGNNYLYLIKADADKLPFRNCSFDSCICSNVLHHLPNIEFALNELYNVLGKGGFFLIYEPNAESCISFLGRIIRKLKRAKDVSVERDQESIVPHEKPLVSNEICRKLANANIISKTTVGIAGTLLCRTAFLNNKKTICQIIVLLDEALSHIPVAEYLGGMIKIMGEKNA